MPNKPRLIGDKDRLLLREDQDRLLHFLDAAVDDDPQQWEMPRRVILLALQSGLRASEIAALQIDHCDIGTRPYRILVWGGKKRDGTEVDEVVIPAALANDIAEWAEGRAPDAPLISKCGGNRFVTRQRIWQWVKGAFRECGLHHKFAVHTLRHRFVTSTWQATGDLLFTQKQARHRTLDMTTRYVHLAALETEAMSAVDDMGLGGEPAPRRRAKSPKNGANAVLLARASKRRRR